MTDDADLEPLLHLEQTFYDAGYADGFDHGRVHGAIQGRALGRTKGFEIWEEIGFYEGFATAWRAIHALHGGRQDQRAVHHVRQLLDLVRQFPTVNPSAQADPSGPPEDDAFDLSRLQRQIRSRYKALCASLGVRPSLRAAPGDFGTSGEHEGDRPDAAGEDTSVGASQARRRPVWTLDAVSDSAPIAQGPSF